MRRGGYRGDEWMNKAVHLATGARETGVKVVIEARKSANNLKPDLVAAGKAQGVIFEEDEDGDFEF